jgi:acylphosphatase
MSGRSQETCRFVRSLGECGRRLGPAVSYTECDPLRLPVRPILVRVPHVLCFVTGAFSGRRASRIPGRIMNAGVFGLPLARHSSDPLMTDRSRPGDALEATRRYRVEGRVQGVGYRAATAGEARRLDLAGWVRNLDDGSVEVLVRGPRVRVLEFERWLKQGPPGARVTGLQELPLSDTSELVPRPFEIRPTGRA